MQHEFAVQTKNLCNSMRSYHTGVFISGALMLGLLYLLAVIPKLDPSETDLEMFMSYRSLAGLTNIMFMVIFTILYCSFSLVCDSLLAGVWGMIALWIGFGKQSVTVTIVAAVIISVVMCQIMAMTLNYFVGAVIFLAVGSIGAVIAWNNLKTNIANMEV